jgi:hypothetical protein
MNVAVADVTVHDDAGVRHRRDNPAFDIGGKTRLTLQRNQLSWDTT